MCVQRPMGDARRMALAALLPELELLVQRFVGSERLDDLGVCRTAA